MRLLVCLGLVICLVACLGNENTELTVTVRNGLGERAYTLLCDPPGGNVPNPAALCELIERNRETMLHPPDLGQVCSGGLSTPYIHLKGRYGGEAVDTEVSGCYGHVEAEGLWLRLLPPPHAS